MFSGHRKNILTTKWVRYALALVLFGLALACRFALLPVEDGLAFLTFYPGLTVAFLLCGNGPGAIYTVLSAAAGFYIFTPPHWSWSLDWPGALATGAYLASAALIAAVMHRMNRAFEVSELNENLADRLYTSTPAMLHSIDAKGRLTKVSDLWLQTLGYERHEVLGLPSSDFLSRESSDFAKNIILPWFFETGEVSNVPYQMVCKDGRILDVLLSARLECDKQGQPSHSLASVVDVTDKKKAERALASSEARYKALVEDQTELVSLSDSDGVLRFVNEAYAKHYGSSTVKLVGTNLYDFIPEAERENVKAHLANVFHSGKPSIGVNPNVSNIGDARWFAWTNRMVTDVDGVGLLLHSVGRDVTEQRAADLALRQSKAELQLVSDSLPGLVSNIDPDLRYRFVNHAYAEWFGVDPLTLIGVSLKEFYGDGVFASIADKLQAALAGETVVSEREVFGRGKVRHCHVVLTPQRNESNEIIGIFAIHTDITDRKQAEQALRTSESFLTRTGAIAGVGGWELDLKANELHWSELTRNLHGVETGYRPTLDAALNFYTPESRTLMEKAVWECIEEGRPYDVEVQLTSLKGRTFWARVTGSAEFEDGELVRIAGAFQDIQERKRIQLELAESYELVRVTLDSIGDAVITTDEKGCIVWLNPVAEALTGWSKEDAHEKALADVFKIVHAGTRLPSLNPVNVALEIGKPVGLQSDTVLISRDGAEFGIEDSASPIRRPDGKILGAVLVFHDVSERQRLSREMTHRAAHDGLTGLVNRVEFEIRLARALELARLDGASHVLMFIDLDEFKVVNDACGHGAGDQLLKQVSAMLQTAVRAQDTVARLGGDEFGLLLESCTLEQGRSIAQKICDQMEVYRFAHDGRRYRVGTSIGIVPVDASWDGLPALLQAADGCCYAAKDAGRNRVHVWVDSDDKFKSRAGEAQWVNRIVAAMDENRFLLYAQRIEPVDGPRSGLHCEILLRLQEETEGPIIVPGSFMPSAERFHLASRIDRWVLNNVFGLFDSAEIRALDIDMIAVNLSGQSIGDRAFHREILRMLGSARFDVKKLCFEITETVAITNLGDAKIFIEEVRALGVKVALDDFGAGASSFGYLRNLPVDILKIDGQFVTGLLDDPLDDVAVRCFVEVAQAVGLKTVAEFVERIEVRDRLLQLGVDYAQGYLLHRPEPLAAVLKAYGP